MGEIEVQKEDILNPLSQSVTLRPLGGPQRTTIDLLASLICWNCQVADTHTLATDSTTQSLDQLDQTQG